MSKLTAVAVIMICGVILRMETLFFASGAMIKEDGVVCELYYSLTGSEVLCEQACTELGSMSLVRWSVC